MFSTVFRKKVATAAAAGRENEKNLSQWSARFFSPPLSFFHYFLFWNKQRKEERRRRRRFSSGDPWNSSGTRPCAEGRLETYFSFFSSVLVASLSLLYIYIYFFNLVVEMATRLACWYPLNSGKLTSVPSRHIPKNGENKKKLVLDCSIK